MDVAVSQDTNAVGADAPAAESDSTAVVTNEDGLLEEELLVEEVSIDGMCGVY